MITKFAIEFVKGIFTKTQTVTYNNGKTVKRIYPSVTANVPEEIVEMPSSPALPAEGIHNMEYAMYAHHMRM